MYFWKDRGQQVLDLRGDFILSHNSKLVRARVPTAAPKRVHNGKYVEGITDMGFFRRLRVSFHALRFVWGSSQALDAKTIERENNLEPAVLRGGRR